MELSGWPNVYKFMAAEYHFTPQQVNELTLIQLCILLGAITPDHRIEKLPGDDYNRITSTPENNANFEKFHAPYRKAKAEAEAAERKARRTKRKPRPKLEKMIQKSLKGRGK